MVNGIDIANAAAAYGYKFAKAWPAGTCEQAVAADQAREGLGFLLGLDVEQNLFKVHTATITAERSVPCSLCDSKGYVEVPRSSAQPKAPSTGRKIKTKRAAPGKNRKVK